MATGTGRYSFSIPVGQVFDLTITWYRAGIVVPMAGFTALMQVRQTRTPPSSVLLTFTTANGTIVLGASDGTIKLHQSAGVTGALSFYDRAYYDLIMTDPGDPTNPIRLLEGRVSLDPRVTVP